MNNIFTNKKIYQMLGSQGPARRKTSKKEIKLSNKLEDTQKKGADHYFENSDDKNYKKKQDSYERKELRVEQKLDKEKRKQSRKSFDIKKDPNKKDIKKSNKQERKDLKAKQERFKQRRKEKESAKN